MRSGEQIFKFGEAVDKALANVRPQLPADLVVARTSDQPRQVKELVSLLMGSLYEAIVLVVIVALIGFWDQRQSVFTWTNCGHLRPLLTRDGTTRELVADFTYPLGVVERERTFPTARINVRSGDRLLLYSDGIVEARLPDGTRFGLERLQRTLAASAAVAPPAAVARIEREVLSATGGEIRDDATQLLLAID